MVSTVEDDPCYPAGHLLQIHPETGEVRNLGRVTKPGTEDYAFQGVEGSWSYPNDLWGGINAGEFDLNGNLWVSNSSGSGSSQMYKVDINNVTAVQTNAKLVAEDYALSTDGRYLFGIKTNRADDRILLERFDLVTQAVTEYDITNLRSPVGGVIPSKRTWGKAWSYGNGNLGFGTGGQGADQTFFQLEIGDPANPAPKIINIRFDAPASYNMDGTSNGFVDIMADLEVKKTRYTEGLPEGRVGWRLEVTNHGNDASSGFVLTDHVPNAYSDVQMGTVDPPNFERFGPVVFNNVYQVVGGKLGVGQNVVFTLTAKLPADKIAACTPNIATLVTNEEDPNLDNNIGEDDGCATNVEKRVVDSNGDGVVDAKDGHGTEHYDGKDYKVVRYDIDVNNPTTNPNSYTLTDNMHYADGVTPRVMVIEGVSINGQRVPGNAVLISIDPSNPNTDPRNFILGAFAQYVYGLPSEAGRLLIGAQTTHTYRIKVLYDMPQAPTQTQKETFECAETGGSLTPGRGLFNQAKLTDKTGNTSMSEDCISIPLDIELLLTKVGFNPDGGVATEPLEAGFALHAANPDGTMGEFLKEIFVGQQGTGTVNVEEGKTYYLVETQAPQGFNLLPKPIKFTVKRDATGKAVATIDDGSTFPATVVANPDIDTVALEIADTEKGEMPLTGGRGAWRTMAIGMMILLGAVALAYGARRKV